jgi:hypothetical protein
MAPNRNQPLTPIPCAPCPAAIKPFSHAGWSSVFRPISRDRKRFAVCSAVCIRPLSGESSLSQDRLSWRTSKLEPTTRSLNRHGVGEESPYRKGESDSILALSLA